MRAGRHFLSRRLRVLLACLALLVGAGVAVPPARAEAPAICASFVATRPASTVAARVVSGAAPASRGAAVRARQALPVVSAERALRLRLYLLHASLLL